MQWATLHFTAKQARWVADESWHPKQKSRVLKNGTYELKVPHSDDRELIMDILKHGAEVLVVEPRSLRDKVTKMLHMTLASYAQTL